MKNPNKILEFLINSGLLGLVNTIIYGVIIIFVLNYFFPANLDFIVIGYVIVNGGKLLQALDEVITRILIPKPKMWLPDEESEFYLNRECENCGSTLAFWETNPCPECQDKQSEQVDEFTKQY